MRVLHCPHRALGRGPRAHSLLFFVSISSIALHPLQIPANPYSRFPVDLECSSARPLCVTLRVHCNGQEIHFSQRPDESLLACTDDIHRLEVYLEQEKQEAALSTL